MLTTLITWLKASTAIYGVAFPHWVPLLFVVAATIEYVLGRSKNPRARSLAAAVMNGISWGVQKTHVTDIPKLGPVVKAILEFISPPPVEICKTCGGTGIESGTVIKNG